jgi:hypothetical protein
MRRSWLVTLLLLGACTGPVRSFNVYESKAGATAESAASAVETARLATDAAGGDKATGRYLTQILVEAEEDAGAAQGVFDGIQPPDRRADELLGEATDTLASLRIAARRGELASLPRLAEPLAEVADKLHAFAEAHA